MRKLRYLILSIACHGLLFWSSAKLNGCEATEVTIELVQRPLSPVAFDSFHSPRKVASGANKKSRSLDLGLSTFKQIQNRLQHEKSSPETGLGSEGASANFESKSESQPTANDFLNPYNGLEMPEIKFMQSLWREIDKSVVNSPYLSEYGHTGGVLFQFDVDLDGRLIESTLRAQAEDRVLKVIAARAIRKALLNEKRELMLTGKRITIHTHFLWSDYQTCAHYKGIQKTHLSFCNYAEDKRKNFSTSEKAGQYLSSLKYGFGAIDEIKKYKQEEMRQKTQFNPFQEYEQDPDWNLGG